VILIYTPRRAGNHLVVDGKELSEPGEQLVVSDSRGRQLLAELGHLLSEGAERLERLSRRVLNERATAAGVSDPEQLGSKAAVIDAITAAAQS